MWYNLLHGKCLFDVHKTLMYWTNFTLEKLQKLRLGSTALYVGT